MDVFLPPWLNHAKVGMRFAPNQGVSRGQYGGPTRVADFGGSKMRASLDFSPIGIATAEGLRDYRIAKAFLTSLEGAANRAYITHPRRLTGGTFPTTDLLDSTFANGLTGLTLSSVFSGTVSDRRVRLTRTSNTGAAVGAIRPDNAISVTPYQPYAFRVMVLPGRGPSDALRLNVGSSAFASDYFSATDLEAGMLTLVFVPYTSTVHVSLGQGITDAVAGDFIEIPYWSCAPCALADSGANLLSTTDINNAAWTKSNSTISGSSVVLPDGSSGILNTIREDGTAAASHFIGENVTVAAGVKDYTFGVALKKTANRTWGQIRLRDESAAHHVIQSINLSTGALGTLSSDAATWGSARAAVFNAGNDWWEVYVTGRLLTGNTDIGVRILVGEADADVTFTGLSQDSIYVWRPTLAQSSVPMQLVETTGSALATGDSQRGTRVRLKGLPASAATLRLTSQELELITSYSSEIKHQRAVLVSDSIGRGEAQAVPAIRGDCYDNAPVILHEPFGYFMATSETPGWDDEPGLMTASAEFEEGV